MKGRICQSRVLYPMKISFRNEHKVKEFSDEENVWHFVNSRSALKGMLSSPSGKEIGNRRGKPEIVRLKRERKGELSI